MAITKRLRVSFDLKAVFSSEDMVKLQWELIEISQRFLKGEKLSGLELEYARIAAQSGPEAAVELMIKQGIVKKLKEEIPESRLTVSHFRAEVRQ